MKVAVLVASRNRPDLVRSIAGYLERNASLEHDLYVVEAGTDDSQLCEHSTVRFQDDGSKGKPFAHNVALEEARKAARESGTSYDYYWVLINDIAFPEGQDVMRTLVETMEVQRDLGILSPTCENSSYPVAKRRPGGGWRPTTSCEYRGFMIRGEVIETVGFLNPKFRYGWGAMHELSYLLYGRGWTVAYSDDAEFRHIPGSGEGEAGLPRTDFESRAKRFAYSYFSQIYGPRWDEVFMATARSSTHGARIDFDSYQRHRAIWATALSTEERAQVDRPVPTTTAAAPSPSATTAQEEPMRLHLACGTNKRSGWVNVDADARVSPDLMAQAHSLPMLPDQSCSVIETCGHFQLLTLSEAKAALKEWRRLLVPGGELQLELPNLARCVELVGIQTNGIDVGLASIFGAPSAIEGQGKGQTHRWGWLPETLEAALIEAGFDAVRAVPTTQAGGEDAQLTCNMRVVATVAAAVSAPEGATPSAAAAQTAASPAMGLATGPAAQASTESEVQAVLAWPHYDDSAALDAFFRGFARVLADRTDVGLFLRVDPNLDLPTPQVVAALQDCHDRILGSETILQIELLEGELSAEAWTAIGKHFVCRISTSEDAARRDALRNVPAPAVSDPAELRNMLGGADRSLEESRAETEAPMDPEHTSEHQEVLDHPERGLIVPQGTVADQGLARKIAALQPWLYPVTMDGVTVLPGIGSGLEPERLATQTACRATLLVEEVLRRVDMRGKSVLDLGCNCAFWPSYYADAGATSLLGIEGRERHVEQAQLFWDRNQFLPRSAYRFEQGDVSSEETWQNIQSQGPFDVTLCAGILSNTASYAELLRRAAAVTTESLIVDARVAGAHSEPAAKSRFFDALTDTGGSTPPSLDELLATLRELGFAPEVMPVRFDTQPGVDGPDSYENCLRVTIVAKKVAVPKSSPSIAQAVAELTAEVAPPLVGGGL